MNIREDYAEDEDEEIEISEEIYDEEDMTDDIADMEEIEEEPVEITE